MTSKAETKRFDCVKSMREIRDQISAEIADMSYDELSQWLDKRVRENPHFSRIPHSRKPARPSIGQTGIREGGDPSSAIGDGT